MSTFKDAYDRIAPRDLTHLSTGEENVIRSIITDEDFDAGTVIERTGFVDLRSDLT